MKYARAIFAALALALATGGVVSVSSWRSRHVSVDGSELSVEEGRALLDRRIGAINLERLPLLVVVDELRAMSSAHIVVRPDSRVTSPQRRVSLHLPPGTLGQALDSLVAQVGGSVGYDFSDGMITIAYEGTLPQIMRTYDVRDLGAFNPHPIEAESNKMAEPPESSLERLCSQIAWYSDQCYWQRRDDWGVAASPHAASISIWADRMVVVQTRQRHRQIARLLRALRSADPEGTSPVADSAYDAWPKGKTRGSANEQIRVYDVRDLLGARPQDVHGRNALTKATWFDSIQRALPDSVDDSYSGPIIAGRLIMGVDEETHRRIVQILRGLRAGQNHTGK